MESDDVTGRQIRIYLVDGHAGGVLTAEIMNWTGKVIVAPRSQLSSLAQRDEVKRTGVYCLVGPDPQFQYRDRVYIGEGDNVFDRLKAHENDETKDFWTRVACVISKDENITKSHGRYLESRLISLAMQSGRVVVANGTAPLGNPLPEADVADMEYFLDQIQLVFPVLGFTFLQPSTPYESGTGSPTTPSQRFVMRDVGTEAFAVETASEFIVLKGSTARKAGTKSWDSNTVLRDELVASGKLADGDDPDYYVFTEDVPFASPSAAATIIAASNRNGRLSWRLESTNQTYSDWQAAKLAAAVQS